MTKAGQKPQGTMSDIKVQNRTASKAHSNLRSLCMEEDEAEKAEATPKTQEE